MYALCNWQEITIFIKNRCIMHLYAVQSTHQTDRAAYVQRRSANECGGKHHEKEFL